MQTYLSLPSTQQRADPDMWDGSRREDSEVWSGLPERRAPNTLSSQLRVGRLGPSSPQLTPGVAAHLSATNISCFKQEVT